MDTSSDRMTARSGDRLRKTEQVGLLVYRAEHSDRMFDRMVNAARCAATHPRSTPRPAARLRETQVWASQIGLSGRVSNNSRSALFSGLSSCLFIGRQGQRYQVLRGEVAPA